MFFSTIHDLSFINDVFLMLHYQVYIDNTIKACKIQKIRILVTIFAIIILNFELVIEKIENKY